MKNRSITLCLSGLCLSLLAAASGCSGGTSAPEGPPAPEATSEPAPASPPAAAKSSTPADGPAPSAAASAEPSSDPLDADDAPAATGAPAASPPAASAAAASGPAGANLHVGSMNVDGLGVENLACRADGLGVLGSMIVVGILSKKKQALVACGPGTKPQVEWTAAKGKIGGVKVKAGSPKIEACVAKALTGTPAPFEGECAATLVLAR
jgi:hypothetical protein